MNISIDTLVVETASGQPRDRLERALRRELQAAGVAPGSAGAVARAVLDEVERRGPG